MICHIHFYNPQISPDVLDLLEFELRNVKDYVQQGSVGSRKQEVSLWDSLAINPVQVSKDGIGDKLPMAKCGGGTDTYQTPKQPIIGQTGNHNESVVLIALLMHVSI